MALLNRSHTTSYEISVGSRVVVKYIIGHIGDDFYGSDDPTNSDKALKDNSWSVHQIKGR